MLLAAAGVCGSPPGFLCERVYGWFGSEVLASVADWLSGRGFVVGFVLLVGWVVSRVASRSIKHFTERIGRPELRDVGSDPRLASEAEEVRLKARAETLAVVFRSVALTGIWVLTGLLVLGNLGVNLGPLVAGAGIAGVAIGFGAQTVVRDFLGGVFLLVEDVYSVGDDIDFGEGRGTVEKVSLRSTTIRTRQGVVWNIPNGKIDAVANFSQLWARAQIDVEVSYECDLREAMRVIEAAGRAMWEDPEWGSDELSEPPEIKGVQELGESGIKIRVRAKTRPSVQWRTERELRLRIKEALDAAGVGMPYPTRTVLLGSGGEGS